MISHNYKLDKICIRKSDRAIFIPSKPVYYTHAQALVDCMFRNIKWYFKRIIKKKKWFWYYWEETGEIWEPKEGKEFIVINYKDLENEKA